MKRKNVIDFLDALQAGGSTNIFGGITEGFNQVDRFYNKNYINKVVLLTDGYGSTPIEKLLEISQKYYKKGISISCIGVGIDYNMELLSTLSQYSNGLNHHVMESEDMEVAFNLEMESLSYPIASGLTVEILYNDKIIYKTLFGFPEQKKAKNTVGFKVNHVYPSLNKIALVKFKLEQGNKNIEDEKIIIKTSYFDENKQKSRVKRQEIGLEWSEESNLELIIDKEIKDLYLLATLNQKMKELVDLCFLKKYLIAKTKTEELIVFSTQLKATLSTEELALLNAQLKGYLSALNLVIKNQN